MSVGDSSRVLAGTPSSREFLPPSSREFLPPSSREFLTPSSREFLPPSSREPLRPGKSGSLSSRLHLGGDIGEI